MFYKLCSNNEAASPVITSDLHECLFITFLLKKAARLQIDSNGKQVDTSNLTRHLQI